MIIALLGLMSVLSFGMRLVALTWNFGIVRAQIPILHVPVEEESPAAVPASQVKQMSQETPAIVMTSEAFYIGDLAAFSVGFSDIRNKFRIAHREGSPQMAELIKVLKKWHRQRLNQYHLKNKGYVVLIPSPEWPAAVVIQVIHYLRESPLYHEVVLAGGLL